MKSNPPSGTVALVRMPSAARDTFAQAAKDSGLTLSAYLGKLSQEVWRERACAELRAARLDEASDREFRAEMSQWEELSGDGVSVT